MEKEILKEILNLLETSGNDQLWYLVFLFIAVTFVNLGTAVYTSRMIDRYKNELKKKELHFSVYNQMQIEKLSMLFEIAHDLKCNTSPYLRVFEQNTELYQLTESEEFIKSYEVLGAFYSKNRYIFPKNIKSHFTKKETNVDDFRFKVSFLAEKNRLSNITDVDLVCEIKKVEDEIGNYNFHKGSLNVMLFCEELKTLIEAHFEELE